MLWIFLESSSLSFVEPQTYPFIINGEDSGRNKLTPGTKVAQGKALESLVLLEAAGFQKLPLM